MDGVEDLDGVPLEPLEDSMPLLGNPQRLRERAARDGFLFFRRLLCEESISPLRRRVLEYANRTGWLAGTAPIDEARVAPGRRIGDPSHPEWVGLQVHLQNCPEMRALGQAAAIRTALEAADSRADKIVLSLANICRVFSPHPELATPPHQDGHFVRQIADFWTAWIPLEECPRTLGPLALLSGSHANGLLDHSGQGTADFATAARAGAVWRTTDFECGDVVLFRPHTVHRALPNLSGNRLRSSMDFRYGYWDENATVEWRAAAVGI
jgi:hypothetical protein